MGGNFDTSEHRTVVGVHGSRAHAAPGVVGQFAAERHGRGDVLGADRHRDD